MNEKDIKARYRNKVGKIIIEVWNGEKWLYVKTLSEPLKEFRAECLAKVSFFTGQIKEKTSQTFAHDLLSEHSKQDTIEEITQKDIEKAKEGLNKLMNDILKP